MKKEEFKEKLKKYANSISIELNDNKLEKFYNYKNLLIEWNKKINLTSITEDEDIINKHFIDCLTIYKYIGVNKKIIDIGTGAGFPGLPLQIVNDKNEMVLFDSLQKRIKVLNEIISNISINNISTLHGRAEEIFQNSKYREKFDIAVSRAVACLNILAEYMLPAVKLGGNCICMKGSNINEEIIQAEKAIFTLGGKIEKVEEFVLPYTDIKRNIVLIKKVKSTPKQYPRRPGTPSKSPII